MSSTSFTLSTRKIIKVAIPWVAKSTTTSCYPRWRTWRVMCDFTCLTASTQRWKTLTSRSCSLVMWRETHKKCLTSLWSGSQRWKSILILASLCRWSRAAFHKEPLIKRYSKIGWRSFCLILVIKCRLWKNLRPWLKRTTLIRLSYLRKKRSHLHPSWQFQPTLGTGWDSLWFQYQKKNHHKIMLTLWNNMKLKSYQL